ncbi:MAG: hydroxymethylbilane synthase [Rhodanobacteraceae bacterium]
MTKQKLTIATRKSALALWQAEHVAARLRALHPRLEVALLPLSTRGDELLDRSLAEVGGKGLFLKELERAMCDGEADVAVHSLKDVPADLEPGFCLAAVLERADPADAFVSPSYASVDALPQGARVGTSSLRRRAQLQALRPDLQILDLRGNVNTRLSKLESGQYDAIILAVAGLERLELGQHIRSRLEPPAWLPAPGQAALAIESRDKDAGSLALLQPLDHAASRATATAERAMNRRLGGSCSVPVGAFARIDGEQVRLDGLVGDVASGRLLRAAASGARVSAEAVGVQVAEDLLAQGAAEFLSAHLASD